MRTIFYVQDCNLAQGFKQLIAVRQKSIININGFVQPQSLREFFIFVTYQVSAIGTHRTSVHLSISLKHADYAAHSTLLVDVFEQTMGTYSYAANIRLGIDYISDTEC